MKRSKNKPKKRLSKKTKKNKKTRKNEIVFLFFVYRKVDFKTKKEQKINVNSFQIANTQIPL